MKIVNFRLPDADGVQHDYEVELYSVKESIRLQLIVAKPFLKIIAELGSALAPALGQGKKLSEMIKSVDAIAAALALVDFDVVGHALSSLPEFVEKNGGPDLVTRVFAQTTRIVPIPEAGGAPHVSDEPPATDMRQELAHDAYLDMAFGDGNFGEMWKAFAMVLVVNFTRLGRNGSLNWIDALQLLTAGLVKVSRRKEETTTPKSDTGSGSESPTS